MTHSFDVTMNVMKRMQINKCLRNLLELIDGDLAYYKCVTGRGTHKKQTIGRRVALYVLDDTSIIHPRRDQTYPTLEDILGDAIKW